MVGFSISIKEGGTPQHYLIIMTQDLKTILATFVLYNFKQSTIVECLDGFREHYMANEDSTSVIHLNATGAFRGSNIYTNSP